MKRLLPLALLLIGACNGSEDATSAAAAAGEAPTIEMAATPPPPAQDPQPGRRGAPPPVLGQDRPAAPPPPAATPWVPTREPQFHFEPGGPVSDAQLADYHVTLSCSVGGAEVGTIVVELWPEAAPITVRNFLRYCDEGFYDGSSFHRILREFMIQGGDPTGTGGGEGPYGNIKGEFSDAPERQHHYGVLSMARDTPPDSAGCQFFIICAETPSVWNLDNQYASFGKMVSGVATLEALANAETDPRSREGARPTAPVLITRAEVVPGPAPASGEKIEQPPVDLGGQPAVIEVQHVLVSFLETEVKAPRSKEEALALATQVYAKARAGEDFTALVKAHSDDPIRPGDPLPGVYRMVNDGARDTAGDQLWFQAQKTFRARDEELTKQVSQGTLTYKEKTDQMELLKADLIASLPPQPLPRKGMAKAFGDVGFSLQVGEIGMAEYHAIDSRFGWHIIKRIK
ncbi:MAG: peptidylprolyl isomerase [Planctomycetes bacterium]|nr:peptidylprolyl isomerase [Planctomycetota bacterium]